MNTPWSVGAPLAVGLLFGWCLQKAGLAHYDRIVNVFRFRDLAVLKFLLTALVTAAVGIQSLQSLGLAASVPVPTTYVVGNLVGGLIFGVGMALSGFCPGTVAAGAGEGRLDYVIPGGLGLYTGAVVFGVWYPRMMPRLAGWARAGEVTLADWLHVEPWLLLALFVETTLITFYILERGSRSVSPTEAGSPGAS